MAPEVRLDARAMLRVLLSHEVRFVVVGGFAAVAHGSPIPTEDLDTTPDLSQRNPARLSEALTELAARVRTDAVPGGLPFSHDAESPPSAHVWNLLTPHGELAVTFMPSGTRGYDDLKEDADHIEAFGVVVPVASLADVIRSKQAANRPQDQRVLPVLREILASRHTR